MNVYLTLFMGILESIGATWIHCFDDAVQKGSAVSVYIIIVGYWFLVNVMPWPAFFAYKEHSYAMVPAFWGSMLIIWLVSFLTSKLTFAEWYRHHFFYGAKAISEHLVRIQKWKSKWQIAIFEFWWCFCIKYIVPWAIYTLIVMTMADNIEERYGNYYIGWQIIGILIPVVGFALFIIPMIFKKGGGDGSFKAAFAAPSDEIKATTDGAKEAELSKISVDGA